MKLPRLAPTQTTRVTMTTTRVAPVTTLAHAPTRMTSDQKILDLARAAPCQPWQPQSYHRCQVARLITLPISVKLHNLFP